MSAVALISEDPVLRDHFAQVFQDNGTFRFSILENSIIDLHGAVSRLGRLDLMIVDLAQERDRAISAIGNLRSSGVPGAIVTISDDLSEGDVRALLRQRASDWLPMLDGELPNAEQILDACQKALNESAEARKREIPAHCVSFLPAAGGVGQTVLATMLGLLISGDRKQPKSTCLIDLNFQHSRLAYYLDVEQRLDLSAIEAAPERVDQTLIEAMLTRHHSGLAVLTGTHDRREVGKISTQAIPNILNIVCNMFDCVLIDLPATWQPWTVDVLSGSDEVFVVTDFSVPGIRQAKELVGDIKCQLPSNMTTRVIVNKYKEKLFGGPLRKRDAIDALGEALAGFVPDGGEQLYEAINLGQADGLATRSSKIAKQLNRIVNGKA